MYGVYIMKYALDYKFDNYLKSGSRNLDINGRHPVSALYTSPFSGYASISSVKEPSTAYSVIYNQGSSEVYLSFNKDYKKIYNFKLKMK
ncbi:hypothetical protein [Clostridium thermarum]|uniref:hypothetical protein n=1 Tax=Clostridium thermarum TaxID=1716543 RepID=UPI00111D53FC|nr:hypothetical protein [Clostridium thermarum]